VRRGVLVGRSWEVSGGVWLVAGWVGRVGLGCGQLTVCHCLACPGVWNVDLLRAIGIGGCCDMYRRQGALRLHTVQVHMVRRDRRNFASVSRSHHVTIWL